MLELTKKKSTCIANSCQQFVQRSQLLLGQLLFLKDQSPLITLFTLEHGVHVFSMLYGWRKFKFFSFVCRVYDQTWATLKHRNRKKYYNSFSHIRFSHKLILHKNLRPSFIGDQAKTLQLEKFQKFQVPKLSKLNGGLDLGLLQTDSYK